MAKYFRFPWSVQGDREPPPDGVQADGSLSYNQGFPFDYERANNDPNYKPVPREGMNGVLYDITEAIAVLQTQGVHDWVSAAQNGGVALPYRINALVRHKDKVWRSLVADNTAEPSADASWADETAAIALATEAAPGIARLATQVEVNDGADDATIITPKKLRLGFQFLRETNGYVIFPSWLGGLILQWGLTQPRLVNTVGTLEETHPLPVQYPNRALIALANHQGTARAMTSGVSVAAFSTTEILIAFENSRADQGVSALWLSVGY
jgi:hypothetical protein